MKRLFFAFALAFLGLLATLQAEVVRPAPEIQWTSSSGATEKLSKFRGQPVVILIAPSPRNWTFRSQVGQLQQVYERLGAMKAICIAAFTENTGQIRSNIPFAIAPDGPRVAYDLNVQRGFAIGIVGRDGNLDYIHNRVTSGQRVIDIIQNSFVLQQDLRR